MQLPKLYVVGSIPIARSKKARKINLISHFAGHGAAPRHVHEPRPASPICINACECYGLGPWEEQRKPERVIPMRFVKNVLAVIGLVAILGAGVGYFKMKSTLAAFDPEAGATYKRMMDALIATGNPAEATVWKAQVKDGLTFDEVDQSIKSIANAMNIKGVGELPLGDQVSAMEGKPWRKLKIYLYCNPLTAAKMIDFSDAYAAYLPCRVAFFDY